MKTSAHNLLIRLLKARKGHIKARRTLYNLPGLCERLRGADERTATCFGVYGYHGKDQWCDRCKKREPLWKEYQKAAARAGAALRNCLKYAGGKEEER